MLLNLIVVGVFVTVSVLVVGGAARMDSEIQISIGKSGEDHEIPSLGKHISYSSSFGDEDFSGPDIPASFDRLYGINSSFHANKSHLTSESLELEAVFPSSSSSSEDEDKVNNTRRNLKDDKKEKLKQNRKTRKKDPDTAVKEEKPKRRKKTEKEDSTAKEQKPKRRRKTTKKNDSENVTKPKRTRKPRAKSKLEATSTAISTTLTSAKTSIKATERTTPSTDRFISTTIITPTKKVMSTISTTEIITSKPSTTTSKGQTTTESLTTEKPTLTITTSLSSTHKPITTKKPIIIKEEKIYPGKTVYKVSSSFTHGAVLPTTTKPSLLHSTVTGHFIKTVTGLHTLDSTTTMLPVMHATEEPLEVKQHTTEDHIQVKSREAGRVVEHPIWEILRKTTTTITNLPEPNIPRLNIRRRKKMPLRFKPPPEGWPGINPSGDPDEFKVVEPEYTFPPNQPTVKNNFWDNKVAVTMSLAQELAQKYQVLTRKPYVPFVHSRQKDRVYSYRNASGYFIYVRERPTYFPTKPTVPYKPTFKFVYQQQPRRFDWRSSTVHRPGPGFVVSNISTSYAYPPLNASTQTLPPRYPIPPHLPRQPYYTPGAYYMYSKQGSNPPQPVYPPGPAPYQAGPYPPGYPARPPPPYPPGQPIFPSGQSYQPPHPPFPLPRQPPLGAVPPPPALGPPPPARPPYPPRAPYPPPPYQNAPYPHGPPQPPPPPPPYARNPYQPSPYQPKPMYQPVYRPPYPPPPASQPFKARVPYGDDVAYEDDYDDRNYIEEQPVYTGPVKGYPLPSPRIRQPRPYYQERPRTLFNLTHGGTKPISLTSKLPAFLARTMFPYIPRGTVLPPGVRHTMLPPSAWRRNKTFTYQDAFNRGFGRIRPLSYGKRVSSFGHVPVNELGPPPPKMGEGYAVNLTSLSRNTSHARRIFGYEPYRPKPKLNIYKGGFGYEPYRGPPGGKKPKGPDYVPYRPFKSKIDRLSLKEYVPYKPFRKDKDKDDRLPMRFDKSRRFSGTPRPTRSYTYPPRRDFKKTSFRKEASVPRSFSGKEPEVKTGLAAYLSEAQLKRMGKGKSLADMFADFFPSTEKSGTNKPAKVTTFSRKSPSLDKSQENVFDDSEALEALANTMVIKEKPTPKPKGMTAREAMRAAAREAAREMEMEDEEQGIYSRKHFNMGGGRPPPFVRRGGARGGGRGSGRGVRRGGEVFRDGGMPGKGKKKQKKGKNRERRSVKDEETEDLVPIGDNRYIWSSQSLLPNRANYGRNHPIDDPSPVRHQLKRGKGRPMVVYIQPRTHIR